VVEQVTHTGGNPGERIRPTHARVHRPTARQPAQSTGKQVPQSLAGADQHNKPHNKPTNVTTHNNTWRATSLSGCSCVIAPPGRDPGTPLYQLARGYDNLDGARARATISAPMERIIPIFYRLLCGTGLLLVAELRGVCDSWNDHCGQCGQHTGDGDAEPFPPPLLLMVTQTDPSIDAAGTPPTTKRLL
jgi:hypothetical protein